MRNRGFLLGVVAAVVVVALWWFFIYSPLGDDLDSAKEDREAAEAQTITLEAELARLEAIEANGPEIDAALMKVEALVPPTPELASFILAANEIATASGVDWISVTPAEPQAGPPGQPSTINLQIGIEGGFFQALDYLNRLEELQRLVVVDAITITAATGVEGEEGTGTTSSGAPDLSINLAGRMFTSAPPPVDPTAVEIAPVVPEGETTDETATTDPTATTIAGEPAAADAAAASAGTETAAEPQPAEVAQ